MSAPRIVARNYTEGSRFATETLGLAPNTFRVTTTVGGLAGYGYELHLAPGWRKAPYAHAIRSKIKFKRGIEVIDHEASVQKESARKVETAPEPPEGWFTFGTHATEMPAPPMEFSTEVGEDGLPLWERPSDEWINLPPIAPKRVDEIANDVAATAERLDVALGGEPWPTEPEEEPDAETGTPEPGEDAEGDEKPIQRRRRRCKICGELVEPDDVEAHASAHEED